MRRGMSGTERAIIDMMTQPADELTNVRRGIIGYRTRRIWHGPMMDVLIYPIYSREFMPQVREALREHRPTSEIQRRLNHRRSQEKLIRLANHNFGDGDLLLTMTYAEPEGEERAKKTIKGWLKRMRRYFRAHGRELKYLCTLETTESEANGKRYHLHAIVNGAGLDRDEIEKIWAHGICNARRHVYQDAHMGGFAAYLSVYKNGQEKAGRKAWWGSRNLVRPPESVADHTFTRARMEKIAASLETDGKWWIEKAFPEFRCIEDVRCSRSDFLPGVYVAARMRRRD